MVSKKLLAVVTAILLLITACDRNRAAITSEDPTVSETTDSADDVPPIGGGNATTDETSNSQLTSMPAMGQALRIPDKWVTENGAYFTKAPVKESQNTDSQLTVSGGGWIGFSPGEDTEDYILVYITDNNTGKDIVLCNKPNCSHDNADCGAFLPPEPIPEGGFGRPLLATGFVFIDGENLYAFNGESTIFRMGLDGTGRTESVKIPDKYSHIHTAWLYDGKLYALGSLIIMRDDYSGFGVQVLLEIDYKSGAVREIWQEEALEPYPNKDPKHENTIIGTWGEASGIWEGKMFIKNTLNPPLTRTQAGYNEYLDNQDVTIYSVDLKTGERVEVFSDKSVGINLDVWVGVDKNAVATFHSRRESALIEFNLLTGEKTILTTELPGWINVNEVLDGKRLLTRDNYTRNYVFDTDGLNKAPPNNRLFYDYVTGKVGEITLMVKANVGNGEPVTVLKEEDGCFYVNLEHELVKDEWGNYRIMRVRVGRISKADYWASNANGIELLDWYEYEDYAKKYLGW